MATTTTTKQKVITQLLAMTGKAARPAEPEPRPVLEQFVYAVLRENATRESADRAYAALREQFYDWNEVRVTSAVEVAEAFDALLSEPTARAQRIIDFLQEVFETTFSFDLESLHKKGVKLGAKTLSRYQAANDYAVACVVQHSLGGHAVPVDERGLRLLKRLGLVEEDQKDLEAIRGSLEHQVPKAKGVAFVDLLSDLAEDCCFDQPPCGDCPFCTGTLSAPRPRSAATASRKPR